MKSRSGVENLRTGHGDLTTTDEEKADVLNSFFVSVCTTESDDPSHTQNMAETYNGNRMLDIDISVDLVGKKLSALRSSSAAGPDGIHPRVVRETADTLSPHLAYLFRRSVDSGILPKTGNWQKLYRFTKRAARTIQATTDQ